MDTVISFDIATTTTGTAIYSNGVIFAFSIPKSKENITNEFLDKFYFDYIKHSKGDIHVIFENLGVGKNGIMFAEIIGFIKHTFIYYAKQNNKHIYFETIQPWIWMREILELKNTLDKRLEIKKHSIAKANRFIIKNMPKIDDDNVADAVNILIYKMKHLGMQLPMQKEK